MATIIRTIEEAVQENLEAICLLIIVTAILYIANIIFGTVLGTKKDGFDFNKFLYGFWKGVLAAVGIFVFCYSLNLFALTLKLINISISVEVITVLEVIGVMATWDIDLAKEVFEKIKSLKELKYISYDDIQINPNSSQQDIGGIG